MKIDTHEAVSISRKINLYLTPYAVFLVVMAAVSVGFNVATDAALAIVVFTGISNIVLVDIMRRYPEKLKLLYYTRLSFNYFFNICIVGLLWPIWPPIWMLLLLSICTVGIFEDRRTTVIIASLFTIVLSFVQYHHDEYSWISICELITRIVTIWTAGLLINRLTHDAPAESQTA
jgi:phosphotransferase system  glucose/maltose/N-acetylglucosamine-specific IIC component